MVDGSFSEWWEAMGKKAQLKLLSTLLCGKCKTSPFDEVTGKMEAELLKVLNRFGFIELAARRIEIRQSKSGFFNPWLQL